MAYDILVFGRGFDGELVTVDCFHDELVLNQKEILQLSGSLSSISQRMNSKDNIVFKLNKHVSNIDGKTYLLGIEDEFSVEDVDLKISWQCPRPLEEK
ncbi:hypothetical protein [Cronobacter malonaticus]|uniref:hypothetical protein n=1 Tax=Cronobacter malonaticus TaxID=413503 RepID=UPI000CFAAB39|nr:hypothetical protein [Cronobacter malonaticus]